MKDDDEPPFIDLHPSEWTTTTSKPKPDLAGSLIDLFVAIGGLALLLYAKKNWDIGVGEWVMSFF